jgi:predicted dehydrogenase
LTEVRWGIVGTGAIGETFGTALLSVGGAVLRGVASRSRGCAGQFAARLGAQRAYRDYTELLQDPAIDIVYVATRNEHHHEDSLAAIDAGKAVLCEKPFTLNAAEAREVVAAARRRGVFCMGAMWMRCSPAVREVLDTVRNGSIGRPRFVTAELGYPIRFDPSDRVFAKPGGGALFDYGIYALFFVHAVLGRPARIRSAACIGPTGVDDQCAAVLEYGPDCQAVIVASLRSQLANAAAIRGTDGFLDRVEPLFFPKRYHFEQTPVNTREPRRTRRGLSTLPQRAWSRFGRVVLGRPETGQVVRREVPNGYAWEAQEVQRCLRAGLRESPEVPLDETIAVLESMDTIRCGWFN